MKPGASSYNSLSELCAKLYKIIPSQSATKQLNLRSSGNANSDKKKLDHASHDPSNEIIRLNKNFECLIDCFRTILDNLYELDTLEENFASLGARITELEKTSPLRLICWEKEGRRDAWVSNKNFNGSPQDIRSIPNLDTFKSHVERILINQT